MINLKTILKIFSDFIGEVPVVFEQEDHVFSLIRSNIKINQELWVLEDSARMVELGSKHVANAKSKIDRNNQIRNDLIREIDVEIANQIEASPPCAQGQFYSESPGMVIDRLAILFIKSVFIKKLLWAIKEKDLKQDYKNKEKIISKQIAYTGDFLNSYFVRLKKKEVFFEIQQPVKLYNDERIKKYIKRMRYGKKDKKV